MVRGFLSPFRKLATMAFNLFSQSGQSLLESAQERISTNLELVQVELSRSDFTLQIQHVFKQILLLIG